MILLKVYQSFRTCRPKIELMGFINELSHKVVFFNNIFLTDQRKKKKEKAFGWDLSKNIIHIWLVEDIILNDIKAQVFSCLFLSLVNWYLNKWGLLGHQIIFVGKITIAADETPLALKFVFLSLRFIFLSFEILCSPLP